MAKRNGRHRKGSTSPRPVERYSMDDRYEQLDRERERQKLADQRRRCEEHAQMALQAEELKKLMKSSLAYKAASLLLDEFPSVYVSRSNGEKRTDVAQHKAQDLLNQEKRGPFSPQEQASIDYGFRVARRSLKWAFSELQKQSAVA